MLSVLWVRGGFITLLSLLLVPVAALAQNNIAGVVRDSSGGVLPGVTVEAASPVLIEKVRTVVANDQGLYQIVDLRPGTYVITFALPGFNTVRREGIVLTGSQTVTLHAEMRVGAIEETITVTGESPVVDVQTITQRRALTADVVDALPSARNFQSLAALIPGVTAIGGNRPSPQDVGGLGGERQRITIHGGRPGDMIQLFDGMSFSNLNNEGAGTNFNINPAEVQEFTYETSGSSAETHTGGLRMNAIPKDGGNLFRGNLFVNFANSSLQSDNLTDDLRSRGLAQANKIERISDINPAFGGPLKLDKLWFFGSIRYNDFLEYAGGYRDADVTDHVFTRGEQVVDDSWSLGTGLRLTWQATPKNKISLYGSWQDRCTCQGGSPVSATDAVARGRLKGVYLIQSTWNSPLTNRILLEAGVQRLRFADAEIPQPWITSNMIRIVDQGTGFAYGAAAEYRIQAHRITTTRAAMSYVTGSQTIRVGFDLRSGVQWWDRDVNGAMFVRVSNGIPNQVTLFTTPYSELYNQNAGLGLYAQERWTRNRLTVNAGVRFDYHNASVPAQDLPATRFVPARSYAEVPDVPSWTDLSPRLGVAYDLFGTGKTAIKAAVNRYLANQGVGIATANNPLRTSVLSATRTWTDNGDWIPQEVELGPLSNAGFGLPNVVTFYDPEVLEGFGKRGFNWESSVGIQHELLPGMAVDAAYIRRSYGNLLTTDNRAVAPSDYDSYCITVPADSRLPGGGGNQICGLYDISTAARARVPNNLVTFAKNYGKQYENWAGVDLNLNARLPRGAILAGGMSTGKTTFDQCDVVGKVDTAAFEPGNVSSVWGMAGPTQLYCHQEIRRTYVKFLGSIRLPWELEFSATLQNLPGPEIRARWTVPNALIAPSLGRNLATGANGTALVELIAPGTQFGERATQVDLRVGRFLQLGRIRVKGMIDLYNAFNSSAALVINTTYGSAWQQPTYIMPGRLVKFGAQVDF